MPVITVTVCFALPQQGHDCFWCYSSVYRNVGFIVKRECRTDAIYFSHLKEYEKESEKKTHIVYPLLNSHLVRSIVESEH